MEEGNPARLEIRKKGTARINEKLFANIKKLPFPLHKREFVFKQIWRKNIDGSISVATNSVGEDVDYGGGIGKVVTATTKVLMTARNIDSNDQCQINLLQYADAEGFIPKKVVKSAIPYALGNTQVMKEVFNRDDEIDRTALASFANTIKNEHQH